MHSLVTLCILSACVALAYAGVIIPAVAVESHSAIPNYSTSYSVADALTGDKKSAQETRSGDVVKGSYSILQPDGVLRTVIYTSDPINGFKAQVINTGKAVHPAIVGGRLLGKVKQGLAITSDIALAAPIAVAAPVAAIAAPVVAAVKG